MEEIHTRLLGLISRFDEICTKNDIKYTLHGGTLLGAIREHGFIPWDDDLDIAMTRKEFLKLESALKYSESYCIYGDLKKQFQYKEDGSIWVDIFICDYIGYGLQKKIKLMLLTALDIMNRDKNNIKLSNFSMYSKKKQIIFKLLYGIGRLVPKTFKVKSYNMIAEKWCLGDKKTMHRSNDQYKGRKEDFPAEWMDEYQKVRFENIILPVIKKYDLLLVKCYGENYMTPIRDERNTYVHTLVRKISKNGMKM